MTGLMRQIPTVYYMQMVLDGEAEFSVSEVARLLGWSRMHVHRAIILASVPEAEFERVMDYLMAAGKRLSTTAIADEIRRGRSGPHLSRVLPELWPCPEGAQAMNHMSELCSIVCNQGVGRGIFSDFIRDRSPRNFFVSQTKNREGFFDLLANDASNAMKGGTSKWLVDRARQHLSY